MFFEENLCHYLNNNKINLQTVDIFHSIPWSIRWTIQFAVIHSIWWSIQYGDQLNLMVHSIRWSNQSGGQFNTVIHSIQWYFIQFSDPLNLVILHSIQWSIQFGYLPFNWQSFNMKVFHSFWNYAIQLWAIQFKRDPFISVIRHSVW